MLIKWDYSSLEEEKKNNFSKLSEEDIKKIFDLQKQGLTQQKIAEEIGCTRSNISYILNKKTWQIKSSTTISQESTLK